MNLHTRLYAGDYSPRQRGLYTDPRTSVSTIRGPRRPTFKNNRKE